MCDYSGIAAHIPQMVKVLVVRRRDRRTRRFCGRGIPLPLGVPVKDFSPRCFTRIAPHWERLQTSPPRTGLPLRADPWGDPLGWSDACVLFERGIAGLSWRSVKPTGSS